MKDTLILIVICIVFLGILSFAWSYVINYHVRRKAQEDEYERKYNWIQCHVETMDTTPANYEAITRMLICLSHLPHKNKEKTSVLTNKFYIRFHEERIARLTDDEHTPEQIFRIR